MCMHQTVNKFPFFAKLNFSWHNKRENDSESQYIKKVSSFVFRIFRYDPQKKATRDNIILSSYKMWQNFSTVTQNIK